MSLHGPITVLKTQYVTVTRQGAQTTVPINYTSPGSGYLEVMVGAPPTVSAFIVVNSTPIFLQNVVNVIPINAGDTINEIQLLSSGSANVLVSARLLPISVAPSVNVSLPNIGSPIVLTTNATITFPSYVNSVLVVAVGGGGAGGGLGAGECEASSGGNTIVSNSYQSITAGGGQGGWSGANGSAYSSDPGSGGTGSVSNVTYYQILNGNAGSPGSGSYGGTGGTIPTGYNTAIQQVLRAAGYSNQLSLSIPSTPGTASSQGSGYGAGGGGDSQLENYTGGGGGSGAVVVGLMSSGTFNITVAPLNSQITTSICAASYANPSYAYGMPGIVYLFPLTR
ncbi:MAG: hypothetical protein QXU98_09330 [Candidatus Parvarchaeota archaeon]